MWKKCEEGVGSKEIEIKIYANEMGSIDLWINNLGGGGRDTLSYMTVLELLELKEMVKKALQEVIK